MTGIVEHQRERLRILVVDDEELARQKLRRLLTSCGTRLDLGLDLHEACNGHEALDFLERDAFDVVFLDIEMPELSGFDVLRQLAPADARSFSLVFQTAYDHFALKAFDENACDYILKPYDEERVLRALNKAIQRAPRTRMLSSDSDEAEVQGAMNYDGLMDTLALAKKWLGTIQVKHGSTNHYIRISDVIAFVAEESYTSVLTPCSFRPDEAETFLSRVSLDSLSKQLNPEVFFRIHRSAIVNRRFIRSLKGYDITLSTGVTLSVAKRSRSDFRKWINAGMR